MSGLRYGRTAYERVMERTEKTEGCWLWRGPASRDGRYGQIKVEGREIPIHRVTYEEHYGPVPAGLELDHLCGNTLCVNPEHLEPVTHTENVRRGRAARLSVDQVRQIKRLLGERPQVAIAEQFGVSKQLISAIKHGVCWGDVV